MQLYFSVLLFCSGKYIPTMSHPIPPHKTAATVPWYIKHILKTLPLVHLTQGRSRKPNSSLQCSSIYSLNRNFASKCEGLQGFDSKELTVSLFVILVQASIC